MTSDDDEPVTINIVSAEEPDPVDLPQPPKREPPMAIMVSVEEQRRIDDIRRRSIELAYQRGHIRRN